MLYNVGPQPEITTLPARLSLLVVLTPAAVPPVLPLLPAPPHHVRVAQPVTEHLQLLLPSQLQPPPAQGGRIDTQVKRQFVMTSKCCTMTGGLTCQRQPPKWPVCCPS